MWSGHRIPLMVHLSVCVSQWIQCLLCQVNPFSCLGVLLVINLVGLFRAIKWCQWDCLYPEDCHLLLKRDGSWMCILEWSNRPEILEQSVLPKKVKAIQIFLFFSRENRVKSGARYNGIMYHKLTSHLFSWLYLYWTWVWSLSNLFDQVY